MTTESILLDIQPAEWELVNRCARYLGLDDRHNPPVLTRPFELPEPYQKQPRWCLRSHDGTLVEMAHETNNSDPFATALPLRLLSHADALCGAEGGCSLTLEDHRYGRLTGRCGSTAVFDLPDIPDGLEPPDPAIPVASATIGGGDLFRAVVPAVRPPLGFHEIEEPPVRLGIEDGAIGMFADWTLHGGHRATFRAAAETEGTAMADLWAGSLAELLQHACRPIDEVRLHVLADHLRVEHDDWTAWVPRHENGTDVYLEVARDHLTEAGESDVDTDGQSLHVHDRSGLPSVRIEAHHAGRHLLFRLSTVVATNVADGVALRSHLDALVRSRPGVKAWLEDGRAIAAIDLPMRPIDALASTLSSFRNAVAGFDVLLAGDEPAARVFEPERLFD